MVKGVRIVVTRPQARARNMLTLFALKGACPYALPLIDILPPTHPELLWQALERVTQMDGVIFISPTAIEQVLKMMTWPNPLPVFVMGPGSAICAKAYGIDNIQLPQTTFDSEGLLALQTLHNIAGKKFMVFSGNKGRTLLVDTFKLRGATVELIEAYQRSAPLLNTEDWQILQASDAIIITSSEAAKNLFVQAGENQLDWLKTRQYFVSHQRIGLTLQHMGAKIIEPVGTSDEAIVADVVYFFNK